MIWFFCGEDGAVSTKESDARPGVYWFMSNREAVEDQRNSMTDEIEEQAENLAAMRYRLAAFNKKAGIHVD